MNFPHMIDVCLQIQPFIGARNAFLHKLFRRCAYLHHDVSPVAISARDHLMQPSLRVASHWQANCELQELS